MEAFARCARSLGLHWRPQFTCLSTAYTNKALNRPTFQPSRSLNCNTASVCKIHRRTYERTYPTVVVLSNGSSINIRYHEPRKIIKLPLDLASLTDHEKKLRLERRKPKKKVRIVEDIDDKFDANKYLNLLKK